MARLSHRNVVIVYDVGIHEQQLFIAMEFIEGESLRKWLVAEERPWRKNAWHVSPGGQRACCRARRGVGSSRLQGRQRPRRDREGRACVTDFGLARHTLSEAERGTWVHPSPSPLGSLGTATQTGAVLGTPAYMAPEQHRGGAADARSDQFSFCVALYEALFGEHPFARDTPAASVEAKLRGELTLPARASRAPARLRRVLARGLSVSPEQRYPSMDALLAELVRDRAARWRRTLGGVAMVACAASVVLVARQRSARSAVLVCRGSEAKLAGVWDDARKGTVRSAFLATGKSYAADSWQSVERALDTYTGDWVLARQDACEATHVRREQSGELLDLRMACASAIGSMS